MSKKIKYGQASFLISNTTEKESFIYQDSVFLPGIAGIGAVFCGGTVAALATLSLSMWIAVPLVAIAIPLALVIGLCVLMAMDGTEGAGRAFIFRHYFNRVPLPRNFDKEYLDTPEYQRVLSDALIGYDIGNLHDLNMLIKRRIKKDKEISRVKSDIVSNEIETLKAYIGES